MTKHPNSSLCSAPCLQFISFLYSFFFPFMLFCCSSFFAAGLGSTLQASALSMASDSPPWIEENRDASKTFPIALIKQHSSQSSLPCPGLHLGLQPEPWRGSGEV